MRIFIFPVTAVLLAACSPAGHRAPRTETPAAGGTPATRSVPSAAPTAPGSPSGTPWRAPEAPGAPSGTPRQAPEAPGGRAHRVTFAVGGSVHRTSVTYALPGGPKKHLVVRPPWSKTFTVTEGQEFDVRAHSAGDGSLSCSLKVDGEVLKDAMSSGGDMTVDCGDGID